MVIASSEFQNFEFFKPKFQKNSFCVVIYLIIEVNLCLTVYAIPEVDVFTFSYDYKLNYFVK